MLSPMVKSFMRYPATPPPFPETSIEWTTDRVNRIRCVIGGAVASVGLLSGSAYAIRACSYKQEQYTPDSLSQKTPSEAWTVPEQKCDKPYRGYVRMCARLRVE